jgi:hypothetical protein
MKKHLAAFLLTASIAGAAALTEPCIPDGATHDIKFKANVTDPGFPPGSEVVPGSGSGVESDPVGGDDPLGGASETTSGDCTSFTVPITNDGGVLSGPNGTAQNGGAEGDCIEVYVKYKIRYKVKVCEDEPTGVDNSQPVDCWYEWRTEEREISPPKEICPC